MSQYWKADNMMRVGERKVSVSAEHGLSYSPGAKVQFFIDASNKFIDGRECYLDFNVRLSLPAGGVPTRLQLDRCTSTLIRNIRIYDGTRSQLLEEISDYASYVAVKYDYDKDATLTNLRGLIEGCPSDTADVRGTKGTTKTPMANTVHNPYVPRISTVVADDNFASSDFLNAKITLPLHTGIFADSSTIFPVMMTNGLYMEIDLNDADNVIKQFDSVMRDVRTPLNPHFHSLNGSSVPDDWVNGSASSEFYVTNDNNIAGGAAVSKFPFVVGETFKFCKSDNNGQDSSFDALLTISDINYSATANGGDGLVKVTTTASRTNNGSDIESGEWVMYSTAVADATSYDASYEISNMNIIISQVDLDPQYEAGMVAKVREGKAIEFDIYSATNYKHSILASDRQTTFQIFSNNSRAKSLLIIPQDSSVYTSAQKISGSGTYLIKGTNYSTDGTGKDYNDVCLASTRSAYTGISDRLSSIQYVINGKRVPSREIKTKKIATKNSIDAFHIYELEKCLDNAGIAPKSFSAFQENFVFGRGFSAGGQGGVMDLRGKDLSVILKYLETEQPTKPKLFNSFVFHIRRLVIRDGSVDVIH
jgi:hypothetical protein